MIYKERNPMTPNYIAGKFTQEYDENPNHHLRSTSNLNLKLGKPQTNAWKRSFAYSGANSLEYPTSQHQNIRYLEHIENRC